MSLQAGSKKPIGLHKVHTHCYSFVVLRPFPDQQDVSSYLGVYSALSLLGATVRQAQELSGDAFVELARSGLRHPRRAPTATRVRDAWATRLCASLYD
jgi:hypothetical protein